MLKKFSIIIFIMIFMFFINNVSNAETPNIYIKSVVKEEKSDIVTLNLDMENVDSNLSSLNLDIKYDKTKLNYVDSSSGNNLKTTVQTSEYMTDGKISIRIISSGGFKNDGTYYKMTFKVIDNSTEQIPVVLELKEAISVTGNSVECKTDNGIIYTKDPGFSIEEKKDIDNKEER